MYRRLRPLYMLPKRPSDLLLSFHLPTYHSRPRVIFSQSSSGAYRHSAKSTVPLAMVTTCPSNARYSTSLSTPFCQQPICLPPVKTPIIAPLPHAEGCLHPTCRQPRVLIATQAAADPAPNSPLRICFLQPLPVPTVAGLVS